MGKLYIVNLSAGCREDVTFRAMRVLKEASCIVTQDTALAQELTARWDIRTPLLGVGGSGPGAGLSVVLAALDEGDVAWLLPNVDDLPEPVWRSFRALAEQGVDLLSVPGPSAVVSALATSGLPSDRFTFLGLLSSSRDARRSTLGRFAHERLTLVCTVRGEHLTDALDDVRAVLGDRQIAICRDRDTWRGRASQAPGQMGAGAWTLVIKGAEQDPKWPEERVRDRVREMLAAGMSARDVAREVASRAGWPKREVYRMSRPAGEDRGRADEGTCLQALPDQED